MTGYGVMGGFGFGGFFMILWWILIIVGIVALVRWTGTPGPSGGGSGSGHALDILKERYARGEIGEEEYQRIKRELTQ